MSEKIKHLNCGFINPPLLNIYGVTYVLLLETNQGWVMIDSGFGTQDFTHPDSVTKLFSWIMRISKDSLPVIKQLPTFKIDPLTVKHLIFTHMHLDHAGGLPDFPWATAHIYHKEYDSAKKRKGILGIGYQNHQWKNHPKWCIYTEPDTTWFGLPAFTLEGFIPKIQIIPMAGHTPGHCMVAIQNDSGWILQSGSACFPFHFDRLSKLNPLLKTFLRPFWGNNYKKLNRILTQSNQYIDVLTGHDYEVWKKHQL